MTYDEYVTAHQLLIADLIRRLVRLLVPFQSVALLPRAWVALLVKMYPVVLDFRNRSAELGREFYDAERERQLQRIDSEDQPRRLPDREAPRVAPRPEPRHDTYLANYDSDWFYEAMEPARETFSKPDAQDSALRNVVHIAVKEVENGGRSTVREAVDTDQRAIGWARVEGGNESCAFCLTLISRGPVYKSAESAGAMAKWHPNCDCKVVPVYDRKNWTGRDAYLRAEQIWKDAPGSNAVEKMAAIRRMLEKGGRGLPAAA